MVNETGRVMDNAHKYFMAKTSFLECVYENNSSIILFGGGNNGKSHLTNECTHLLDDYTIYQPNETYTLDEISFQETVSDGTKKIMHFLFNPFEKWNIEQPSNMKVIDMSEIHF